METNLTVITFLHANEKHLNRCIKGLLRQKIAYKWIIVGFNDPFIDKSQINYQFLQLNSGINNKAAAYNFILPRIDTKYIAFNDADDISLENRFLQQVSYLNEHTEIDILGGSLKINGMLKGWEVYEKDSDIKAFLLLNNPMVNSTVMIRNKPKFWGTVIKYNPELNRAEDYQFWMEAAKLNLVFANINVPLIDYLQVAKQAIDQELALSRAIRKMGFNFFAGKEINTNLIACYHAFAEGEPLQKKERLLLKNYLIAEIGIVFPTISQVLKTHEAVHYQKVWMRLRNFFKI